MKIKLLIPEHHNNNLEDVASPSQASQSDTSSPKIEIDGKIYNVVTIEEIDGVSYFDTILWGWIIWNSAQFMPRKAPLYQLTSSITT